MQQYAVDEWTSVARIIRPQGRRGEVLADVLTDFPERFSAMAEVWLRRGTAVAPAPVALEISWLHKGRIVLKLANVDSISDAETLRGAEIVVPRTGRVPLEDGAAYIDDLIGCILIDTQSQSPTEVGTVCDVIQQPQSTDLLVVAGSDGTEHWVPFAREHLLRMDVANRRIEMRLPPGLLEINAPLTPLERSTMAGPEREDE